MMSTYSERLLDRAQSPLNRREDLTALKSNDDFKVLLINYQVPNSNGVIDFHIACQEGKIKEVFYKTNIKGPSLGFLDTLAHFMKETDAYTISHLNMREIESFLRDKNSVESIPNNGAEMYRIFEIVNTIQDHLKEEFVAAGTTGGFISPSIENYSRQKPYFYDFETLGNYGELKEEEQYDVVNLILERIVNPLLAKDGGGVECAHLMGSDVIVINYLGNCSSCSMSLTTTMDFVQAVLREELGEPGLMVITDS
ncbi:MAG: NifU family protein [Halobacteriovoraceae bacterium]|jgi:Fe-S cluster biogenesis protein NfuA|nr:NifU family protein [Halobacteriovoraceae bacterium]